MPHIHRLDPSVVNKIAAGEVIERPASVVKELLENALDAGATRIDTVLEHGGATLIRVTDDGCGVPPDDLPLAVASHATSKITNADDLFAVRTLGFRGEALASIASVSRLQIVSRPPDRVEGCRLVVGEDGSAPPQPCAAPPGTTVEVRNLFYNVPARRKFLRQPPTEFTHVTEQVARLALAHPCVAFSLTHNGRSARQLPPTQHRRERIADFYGRDLADCLIEASRDERGLGIEALFAPPAQSRASTKWQYVFLNGRFVSDRRIGYAVREAFRGLVEHDRFPVVFLFLTAEPSAYDVNVHPTKIEVRWRDAGLVQSQVLAVLRETLLSHDLTPSVSFQRFGARTPEPAERLVDSVARTDGGADHHERARRALADYLKSIDPTQARLAFHRPPFAGDRVRPSIRTAFEPRWGPMNRSLGVEGAAADTRDAAQPDGLRNDEFVTGDKPPAGDETPAIDPATNIVAPDESAEPGSADGAVAGPGDSSVIQVHNTYIIAQTDEGIVIVDQHALHERILYERFRAQILAGPLESQRLLMPPTIDVAPEAMAAARRHAALLGQLGIELSPFGPTALAIQSFPALLEGIAPAEFVSDLLDKLVAQDADPSSETLIHQALDMMACKAAVKAGDPLTTEEMIALLAQRHLTERSSNCPHGRPTTLQLSTRDLERQFRRV